VPTVREYETELERLRGELKAERHRVAAMAQQVARLENELRSVDREDIGIRQVLAILIATHGGEVHIDDNKRMLLPGDVMLKSWPEPFGIKVVTTRDGQPFTF
jgi:hypothetical protein